jgi:hypothetical protein
MCMSMAVVHGGANRPWYSIFTLPFLGTTTVCTNTTARAAYLTNINNLINSLQGNASYTAVLQFTAANFVAYIRSPSNQGLLSSNCTAFVAGVKTAKLADIAGRRLMEKIDREVHNRIRQVPRTVVGSYARNDMDVSDEVR